MSEPIKWWTGEFWFLDNSYETSILFQNLIYPSISHAFLAAQTDKLDLKIRISHSPLIALKKLADEVGDPYAGFEGPNTMRKLIEYKFGYKSDLASINMTVSQSQLAKRLITTAGRTLIYSNHRCSTFYGSCECPKHKDERGKNVTGGLIMSIREKLIDYVTKDTNPFQTCSCEKPNEAFFLYVSNGKLWLKPFCQEHQALAAMAAARLDDDHGVYRFEKDWFLTKKEPVNKIVVPRHHHTIRPDVFNQTHFDEEQWERQWSRFRQEPEPEQPKLPKNVIFYLSGRIS